MGAGGDNPLILPRNRKRRRDMYKQVKTDKKVKRESGAISTPIITLADKYGGRAQFIYDDHCLVLLLKQPDNTYKPTPYIFPEALQELLYHFAK